MNAEPLTEAERDKKDLLLPVIRKGKGELLEVLDALEEIGEEKLQRVIGTLEALEQYRRERLYRPLTFKEFCEKEFGRTDRWARYQGAYLKQLKELIAHSGTTGSEMLLPENERQARAMRKQPATAAEQDAPGEAPEDATNGTEGMDGPRILKYVRKAEEEVAREADVVVGGQILGQLGKAFEANVRLLGRAYRQAQQRHPSFEKGQDLIAAAAREISLAADLNVPAWAQEEPGPTGKRQTGKQRRAA